MRDRPSLAPSASTPEAWAQAVFGCDDATLQILPAQWRGVCFIAGSNEAPAIAASIRAGTTASGLHPHDTFLAFRGELRIA